MANLEQDLKTWLTALGASAPQAGARDVEFFTASYQQESRGYHDDGHREYMGSDALPADLIARLPADFLPAAKAIHAIGGQGHDLAYLHVDGKPDPAKALHETVKEKAAPFLAIRQTEGGFAIDLTEAGKTDPTLALVKDTFGLGDQDFPLAHNKSGNEFASAVATAKWMEEKGAPKATIAAVSTTIAATWPFQPSEHAPGCPYADGYMGKLAHHLREANARHGLGMDEWQINACMHVAVDMANRDIASFYAEDFRPMIHNGLMMLPEERPDIRGNAETLTIRDQMAEFGPGFYGMLKDPDFPIQPENIVHRYKDYPDAQTHQARIQQIHTNIDHALAFNQAKQVGLGLAAAIATAVGEPDATAPDFVHVEEWPEPSAPAHDDPVLEALHNRETGDAGGIDAERSPIAARIYETAGPEGVKRLHGIASDADAVATPEGAKSVIQQVKKEIGTDTLKDIIGQLRDVAAKRSGNGDRAERLEQLAQKQAAKPAGQGRG